MIDTITDRKNLYERLLPKQGEPVDTSGNMWIFFNQPESTDMKCSIFFDVLFPMFGHISSRCRQCFKVVVTVPTVVDLFDLYEIQRKMGVHCKCGFDERELTDSNYVGFFYNKGLDNAKIMFNRLKKLCPDYWKIIIKRYCTEFEIGLNNLGPSNELPPMTKEEMDFEKHALSRYRGWINLGQMINLQRSSIQPKHVIKGTMGRWIHSARRYRDKTYKTFTNGRDLYETVVTYHE